MGRQAVSNARAVRVAATVLGVFILISTTVANPGDAYGASRWGDDVGGFMTDASMSMSAPMMRMVDGLLGNQAVDDGADNRLTILATGLGLARRLASAARTRS